MQRVRLSADIHRVVISVDVFGVCSGHAHAIFEGIGLHILGAIEDVIVDGIGLFEDVVAMLKPYRPGRTSHSPT